MIKWIRRIAGRGPAAWLLAGGLAVLAACGGGGGDGTATGDQGTVVIGLTDAPGDFVTYTVDVVSLTLTKANGVVVQALPVDTRVDFARLTELTEFLTAATVPGGVYVRGTMVLDYANADIQVEDAAGNAVKVAAVLDAAGNPVGRLEVSVRLEGRSRLVIAPGIPAWLTLDFDLAASNSVSFDAAGVPTVTVQPFLVAEVDAERNKPHRVRGPLKQVQADAGKFQLYIRPFGHRLHGWSRHFGVLTVHTTDVTVYEVDGVTYQGPDGLAALAAQPQYTGVIVVGDIRRNPRRFEAREVYAGTSVPGGGMDAVHGSVVARSGDVLTVRGATLVRADGTVIFNDTVSVRLDASTTVLRQASTAPATIADISVGQRITVLGTLTNTDVKALELDAANGYARMEISTVRGSRVDVAGIPEQPLPFVVDVATINGRSVSLYDFSGTGTDAANDADPGHYEVDTGVLDTSGIAAGAPVEVRGFPAAFGTAPPDFSARTVVDLSAVSP